MGHTHKKEAKGLRELERAGRMDWSGYSMVPGRMIGYSRSLNESKIESGLGGLRLTSYFGQVFRHRFSPTDQSPRTQSRWGSRSKKWEGDRVSLPNAIMVSREETSNCRCHQDSKLLPPPISMPRLAVLKPAELGSPPGMDKRTTT